MSVVVRSKGRGGRPWRRLQQQVWREETHCWRCHRWVNPDLPPRHPMSRSVDHVVPVSLDERRALDRTNARLAHYRCNSARGNRMVIKEVPYPSRDW